MEPITHFMTGACLARAGFNRKAAYATLAMTLAAEAPDLDVLWSANGPVAALQHHRGITHTLIGLPFDGLIVLSAVWLVHLWRVRRARAEVNKPGTDASDADTSGSRDSVIARPLTVAPVRWGLLYGFVLIALLSHLLLDWTNNYGLRPFFPFNAHWYAASICFIFEPVLFAVLLMALIAPALFALIGGEVGARRETFRGRGWAIFALFAMVALWGWRAVEHNAAVQLASTASYGPAETTGALAGSDSAQQIVSAKILRVTASPYPGNPYRWHTVVETPQYYQMASVDTLPSTVATDPEQDLFYKPASTPAILVAKRSWLGEVYLDWSSWPVVTEMGPTAPIDAPAGTPDWTAVRFMDLRFLYDTPMMQGRSGPPLSGMVYVDAGRRVARMELSGHVQR
ncbi:MAG TPA: metal-dependent hydrolase [Acidobacteriaceae bacterium]|nr:metal-dependent hydrolase [Acidobacteriaceae bacterium]